MSKARDSITVGYVYCLSNDTMPGIYKIGRTDRTVEERMRELFSTGVPVPFKCEFSKRVRNSKKIESDLHFALNEHRVHRSREFFRISIDTIEHLFNLLTKSVDIDLIEQKSGLKLIPPLAGTRDSEKQSLSSLASASSVPIPTTLIDTCISVDILIPIDPIPSTPVDASSNDPIPSTPVDASSNDPIPSTPVDASSNDPIPSTPVDASSNDPIPSTPVDASSNDPIPSTPVDASSNDPIPSTPVDASSNDPIPSTPVDMSIDVFRTFNTLISPNPFGIKPFDYLEYNASKLIRANALKASKLFGYTKPQPSQIFYDELQLNIGMESFERDGGFKKMLERSKQNAQSFDDDLRLHISMESFERDEHLKKIVERIKQEVKRDCGFEEYDED